MSKIMNHNNLQNIGTFTHNMIDKHIINQETAHFGQNLTKNGTPSFKSIYLTETKEQTHGATKEYVDSIVNGLEWKRSVREIFDFTSDTRIHNQYDRYISIVEHKSWKKNYIYEFDGKNWIETNPTKGMALYVEDGNFFPNNTIVFNGMEWIKFGSTMNHETLYNSGIYSHHDLDLHMNNTTTAHFDQDLTTHGKPTFRKIDVTTSINTGMLETNKCKINEKMQIGNFILPKRDNDLSIVSNEQINIDCVSASNETCSGTSIKLNRALGDVYSPEKILKNTNIGSISFCGYDGREYNSSSVIQNVSTEDFSEFNHGSRIDFYTTKNNSNEKKLMFQIENDGKINCLCEEDDALNVSGGIDILGNINVKKMIKTNKMCFGGNDEFSLIINDTNENLDQKVISLCGGGTNNINRGGVINISGNDSNLDGTIQIKSGKPNGKIEFSTNNIGMVIDKNGTTIINNIKCLNKIKLPCLTESPINSEIGDVYFDVNSEKIKIFTSNGYKTLMFE